DAVSAAARGPVPPCPVAPEPDNAGRDGSDDPLQLPALQEVAGVAGQLRRPEAQLPGVQPAPANPQASRSAATASAAQQDHPGRGRRARPGAASTGADTGRGAARAGADAVASDEGPAAGAGGGV